MQDEFMTAVHTGANEGLLVYVNDFCKEQIARASAELVRSSQRLLAQFPKRVIAGLRLIDPEDWDFH